MVHDESNQTTLRALGANGRTAPTEPYAVVDTRFLQTTKPAGAKCSAGLFAMICDIMSPASGRWGDRTQIPPA